MIEDEILKQEAKKAEEMIDESYSLEEVSFSEDFEDRLKKKRKKTKNSRCPWVTKVAAAAIILVLIGGIGNTKAVAVLVDRVLQSMTVEISSEEDGTQEGELVFTYLPDGMRLISGSSIGENTFYYVLQKEDGEQVSITRIALEEGWEQQSEISTEGELYTIYHQGVSYWVAEEESKTTVIWVEEGQMYYLSGSLKANILLKIAQGIEFCYD